MNEQDKEAFEKWKAAVWDEVWQAAIEYEQKRIVPKIISLAREHEQEMQSEIERSKKLVEALNMVQQWWYNPHLVKDTEAEELMDKALKEYRGEK